MTEHVEGENKIKEVYIVVTKIYIFLSIFTTK